MVDEMVAKARFTNEEIKEVRTKMFEGSSSMRIEAPPSSEAEKIVGITSDVIDLSITPKKIAQEEAPTSTLGRSK